MDKRLNEVVQEVGFSIDSYVESKKLNELTTWRELAYADQLNWEQVKQLHIVGTKTLFQKEKPNLKMGCYVDKSGTWVLLAGLKTKQIQHYVDCCPLTLECLVITYTDITGIQIPPMGRLQKLQLSNGRKLAAVSGLESLSSLQYLSLYFTECNFDLDLALFPALRELDLTGSEIRGVRLNRTLRQFTDCNLSRLEFEDMGFLAFCPELTYLNLSGTPICRIPEEIRQLKNMKRLRLMDLVLEELPDWLPELGLTIGRNFGFGISLQGTDVQGVDMSIFDQSQEMIREWFASRKRVDPVEHLHEMKVVFLGDGSTGKSLTVARLLHDGADAEDFDGEATPGIAIADRNYTLPDGRKLQVHFWDFGGQEILHSMHRIFLSDRTLYVVMINARNNTQDNQARYWLHNVNSFAPGCPVLLVLNQIDENPNASVNERSLRRLYPNLGEIVRLSALKFDRETFNREFTDKMLAQIMQCGLMENFIHPLWKAVKDRVRQMDKNYLRGIEFQKICRDCGVEGQSMRLELLKRFHNTGVSFYCGASARLRDYVVLKPEWITNGIYTILWNKRDETTNGMVDREEIYRLLAPEAGDGVKQVRSDMTYKLEDVDYVLSITRKFRLSFPLDGDKEFIPMLCDANALAEADVFLEEPGVIEFRLEYDYLPANVLHRLMVDMRKDLRWDKVWLTGALFEQKRNGVSALVKSEGDVLSIYIKAADRAHKAHTYLNTIRGALDAIHKEMGLKEPVTMVAYTEDGETDYFPYEMLEGARKHGQETQYSQKFRRMIPIEAILNGSDSQVEAKKKKLLRDIGKACMQLQYNRLMCDTQEDNRNDVLRDALRNMDYHVADQTHVGRGGRGIRAGSLDVQLLHEDNLPWVSLEAMNLTGSSRSQLEYWDNHLNRLMDNYNPAGQPTLFLVSYINCSADTYHKHFGVYNEHAREYMPPRGMLRERTLTEVLPLGEQYAYLRVTRSIYDLDGTPVTVYHYFVGFVQDDR